MNVFVGDLDPSWHDMSNYVVHFTKNYRGKSAYDNMMSILWSGKIKARNSFGIGRNKAPDGESQRCVCFSEVPAHRLRRIANVRSEYGVGFHKDFVVHRHGNPILYAYKDSPLLEALRALAEKNEKRSKARIWQITPFVDAPGKYSTGKYFFEWEREWRKVGDFAFSVDDVAFLVIPEKLHKKAKRFFADAKAENLGPSYEGPFIDPFWGLKDVRAAFQD